MHKHEYVRPHAHALYFMAGVISDECLNSSFLQPSESELLLNWAVPPLHAGGPPSGGGIRCRRPQGQVHRSHHLSASLLASSLDPLVSTLQASKEQVAMNPCVCCYVLGSPTEVPDLPPNGSLVFVAAW
jgi:hypothetical protein